MSIQNSRQVGDVKVMLKTGVDGNGIASIEKTGTSGLVDTYTITFTSGSKTTFTVTNGKGISSIAKTGTSGLVDTYTITFNDGSTSTFTVTNGNGISNIAKTGTSGLVDTYTITYTDGTTSTFQVTNGADTNAQIAERVTNPAQRAYNIGEYVILSDTLYKVTAPIASGANFVVNTNITATQVMDEVNDRVTCQANGLLSAKNLLPLTVKGLKSLNTSGTWSDNTLYWNGNVFEILTDDGITVKGIKISGTNNGTECRLKLCNNGFIGDGEYILNGSTTDYNSGRLQIYMSYASGSYATSFNGSSTRFTVNNGYNVSGVYLLVDANFAVTTPTVYKPMVRLASDTDPTFQPFAETNLQLYKNKMSYADQSVLGAHQWLDISKYTNNDSTPTVLGHNLRLQATSKAWAGVFYTLTNLPKNTLFRLKFGVNFTSGVGGIYVKGKATGGSNVDLNSASFTADGTFDQTFDVSNYDQITLSFVCTNGSVTTGDVTFENLLLKLASDASDNVTDHAMTNLEITNPTFTEASTRANIASGESLPTILGKIKKFFTDLKTVAFTGAYSDLSGIPDLKAVATSGSYNDLSDAPTVYSPTVYSSGEQLIGKWLNGDNLYSITIAEKQSATQSDVTNKTRKYIYPSSMPFDASDIRWIHDAFIITDPQGTSGYVYPFMQNYYVEDVNLTNAISYVPLQVFTDYYFVFTIFYTKH